MKFIKDGLFGLAIGEAFGVQLDMESSDFSNPVTTMQDSRAYDCPIGSFSDDTSMLLASMDSFIKSKEINSKDILDALCDWINKNAYSSTDYLFDISKTVRISLMDYWKNKNSETCGILEEDKQDASCLSRVFLLNMVYSSSNISDEKLIDELKKVIRITHNNEISFLGCFIAYKYMKYIIDGNNPKYALTLLKRYNYKKYFTDYSIEKYKRILFDDIKTIKLESIDNSSNIVSILESVLFIISNTDNYKDAIITSNMLGNANGVRSSITGLFAGLIYSEKSIPKEWNIVLKRKDYLNKMSRKIKQVLSM
ncbi:MAG: ADP-ribosylglycohydrolase family protein [Bacilli bacterium]|nr:ADP-ribosylglycohydrolase family protein [Bacilli bacterium]